MTTVKNFPYITRMAAIMTGSDSFAYFKKTLLKILKHTGSTERINKVHTSTNRHINTIPSHIADPSVENVSFLLL
jgi:hypothetical protein